MILDKLFHPKGLTLYFKNGVLFKTKPPVENYYDPKYIVSDGVKYDMENAKDITNIKPPKQWTDSEGVFPDVTKSLDYILRMKATSLSRRNMELAVVCLRKANELMFLSPIGWLNNDYMRVVQYLIKLGKFDEAEEEKQYILEHYTIDMHKEVLLKALQICKELDTTLVEAEYNEACSAQQAMYRGRIFCIDGSDERFPLLTNEIFHCGLSFYPFLFGISIPSIYSFLKDKPDIIKFSNRPFIDDRTEEEKQNYNKRQQFIKNQESLEKDRLDYYKMLYANIAVPKSFSAYRNMKNNKPEAFKKLKEEAKKAGISLHE